MNACKVGSIRQIHQRLLDAGYNVSEYTLRIWVKQSMQIPLHLSDLIRQFQEVEGYLHIFPLLPRKCNCPHL